VQFKQEQLAGLQRLEGDPRRRPEIHFAEIRATAQRIEPIRVGDGDD